MNDRIRQLKEWARRAGDPDLERMHRLQREEKQRHADEPIRIQEALGLAHAWRNRPIVIHEHELIVGDNERTRSDGKPLKAICFRRRDWENPNHCTEETRAYFAQGLLSPAGNHSTMDYGRILGEGFNGLIRQIDDSLSRHNEPDKKDLLKALRIVAQGYIHFCRRHGDEAEAMALAESDSIRRTELLAVADNCRRVIAEAPRNFHEACQACWFAFFFMPDAPGRIDQYLWPFYEQEIASGNLDQDRTKELLSCLWIKYFAHNGARQGVGAMHHVTIGGLTSDGSCGANAVTRLILDVVNELHLVRPQVGFRWNSKTPKPVLEHAVRCLGQNTAMIDFCNDEQIIPALCSIGVAEEDARDFSLSGCHEVIITGKAQMGSVEGFINMPKTLRLLFGLENFAGPDVYLNDIDSYDSFLDALDVTLCFVADVTHEASVQRDREAARNICGDLTASLAVCDCIEQARTYNEGGARYNFCNWDVIGIANLADSIVAIRRLVFEEQLMTLRDLSVVLAENWAGHESLRRRILNEFAHFGNDDDDVDAVAADLITRFAAVMKRNAPYRGGEYILGSTAGGENMHIEFGRITGATPDGRLDGAPLADSIGAAQGRDRRGVTALLTSVAKLPHSLLPTATTLNIRLDPKLLESQDGVHKVAAMICTHFLTGGQQFQFNFVDREALLRAKADPDANGDLMVRVAGYCAPFVSLWDDLQDEIISRTAHRV